MHHRYGRHGPHAWRRWRERRLNRRLPYLDNRAYTAVIYVQLPPVNIERIIIIMNYEDPGRSLELVDDGRTTNPSPIITVNSAPNETDDSVRDAAQMAGMQRAEQDVSTFDIPNETELPRRAKKARVAYITENPAVLEKTRSSTIEIARLFESEYIKGYKDQIAATDERGNEVWPDEITRTAQKRARTDKESDHSNGKTWHPKQIAYRAIAHALECLDLDRADDIDRFIELYKDAYGKYPHRHEKEEYTDQSPQNAFFRR